MGIILAPNYTQRMYRWTQWKAEYARRVKVGHQHDDSNDVYLIWFYDGPEVHLCTIWKGAVPAGVQDGYTQEQNDADQDEFESDYLSTSNMTLDPRNSAGYPLQTEEPRVGKELILVTHDFCDPTTWYTDSVRVSSMVMTASLDNLEFTCSRKNWIDMTHGKLFDEDSVKTEVVHQYSASVWVDGVLKTERVPFAASGGDYVIDYSNGKITFPSPTLATVTAGFSYANGSTWVLEPEAGKKLNMEVAEAQFGVDLVMNDAIEFQVWVYNPYNLPNKFKYDTTTYKTVRNLIDEALGSYPLIKSFGGSVRGMPADVYGFPFRYGTIRSMKSSQGAELRVKLKNDYAFSGSYATATFYCTVHDDT